VNGMKRKGIGKAHSREKGRRERKTFFSLGDLTKNWSISKPCNCKGEKGGITDINQPERKNPGQVV